MMKIGYAKEQQTEELYIERKQNKGNLFYLVRLILKIANKIWQIKKFMKYLQKGGCKFL